MNIISKIAFNVFIGFNLFKVNFNFHHLSFNINFMFIEIRCAFDYRYDYKSTEKL